MTAFELEPVYKHHDLLVELGKLEMAMEHLQEREISQQESVRPRLEQRMVRVQQEISQLAA
jgi:hypothetical protein